MNKLNPAKENSSLDLMLGNSPAIQVVKSLIKQVAGSDITVLIAGESGTGKELVAQALHDLSGRKGQPFLTLNCGAIPEGIFESEIFGHEKGSFTSAEQRRKGYFELANNGTLFLDEIGEMPLSVQVKILRVFETGSFIRVGGTNETKVNVRIIAATNRDLSSEVMGNRFRQDLYYRLKAITISVPPLRERSEDIPVLVGSFTEKFCKRNRRPLSIFDKEAVQFLKGNYWTGNVRELKNFVESMIALSPNRYIKFELVRSQLRDISTNTNLPVVVGTPDHFSDRDLIFRTLLDIKNEMNLIKGMVGEVLKTQKHEVKVPFSEAEEVVSYSMENAERINSPLNQSLNNVRAELPHNMSLDELEVEQIRRTLLEFNGNRRLTANALKIGERTLYRKIKQYNL